VKFARSVFGTVLLAVAMSACSQSSRPALMNVVREQLDEFHDCIPLGWDPVPIEGSYIIGYSAEIEDAGWIPPLWIGGIRTGDLRHPEGRAAFEVLEHLVRAGMAARTNTSYGFQYRLSQSAMPYFWGDDQYGNNPEHAPYLCYSRIVPQRVLWSGPVHLERGRDGSLRPVVRAAFDWKPEPEPAWVTADAFLQSHSVVLAPPQSPTVVKFADLQGSWEIERVDQSFLKNRLVAPSVWPKSP
jgi:hypothetical protein